MAERLKHDIATSGTANLDHVIPEWLDRQNWKAFVDRFPLYTERNPVFINEARIVDKVAGPVIEKVLSLPENTDRNGVVLAFAHRGDVLINPVAILYGEIRKPDPDYGEKLYKYTDYARLKANFLINRPNLTASQENLTRPFDKQWLINEVPIPGGAIAFANGMILSMSGLPTGEKDTAAVLAIGIEAHLIRDAVARKLARRFNCFQSLTQITDALRTNG